MFQQPAYHASLCSILKVSLSQLLLLHCEPTGRKARDCSRGLERQGSLCHLQGWLEKMPLVGISTGSKAGAAASTQDGAASQQLISVVSKSRTRIENDPVSFHWVVSLHSCLHSPTWKIYVLLNEGN